MPYALSLSVPGSGGRRHLGSGFLLHSSWAVTANHCVRRLAIGDPIDLTDADDTRFEGVLHSRSENSDLALIRVPEPRHGERIPPPSQAIDNAFWRGPCRPTKSDPLLTGTITAAGTEFVCVGGEQIAAVQLLSHQQLDDYTGYSGSPIQQEESDHTITLVGLLIQQYLSSFEPDRATNVIWAADIHTVIKTFAENLEASVLDLLANPEDKRRAELRKWAHRNVRDLGYMLEGLDLYAQEPTANPAALALMTAYLPKFLTSHERGNLAD